MEIRVVYQSSTGNTKKAASAIAETMGCKAEPIASNMVLNPTDLLFLGCSIYQNDIHQSVKQFISEMDSEKIKNVALFSTGFENNKKIVVERVKALLEKQGITLMENSFFCKGRFLFFNMGHPNSNDLAIAKEFAKSILTAVEKKI